MLQNSVILAALSSWITQSSAYAGGSPLGAGQVRRGHENGPTGQAPYVILQPLYKFKRVNLTPLIHKHNGTRYRINTWEITAQIDAYRGEPEELLALCQEGLIDPDIRKAAFFNRGITVHGSGEILSSPKDKNEQWERHAQMQIKLRYSPAVETEIQTLTGVLVTYRFSGQLSDSPTLITSEGDAP